MEKKTKKEIAVIKLEAITLAILVLLLAKSFIPFFALAIADILFSIGLLFFLFTETRKLFEKEFAAYFSLFFFLFAALQAGIAASFLPLSESSLKLWVFFAIAAAFLVFMVLFRALFSKKTITATVISSGSNFAIIETEFDLLSMVKVGTHKVIAKKKIAAGKKVKVGTKQGLFGRVPAEIIE